MNIAIRILKWLGIIAFTLGAMFLLIISNLDSLVRAYDKWTFEHQSVVVEGVYAGMSRSDILLSLASLGKMTRATCSISTIQKRGLHFFILTITD